MREKYPETHEEKLAQLRELSIVVESYNLAEGSSPERLRGSLQAAVGAAAEHGRAEVLLADAGDDPEIPAMLRDELNGVRRVPAAGLPYDEAKAAAVEQARGELILFLDGDVIPARSDWASRHAAALRSGAAATSGFTRYEGGLLSDLCTVMDFGFLLPVRDRELRCYVSNNSGFRRETLAACPVPTDGMRCNCYHHADLLRRRGTPARMVTEAPGLHEEQPFWDERLRQGYDRVAACWSNPELPEARLLALGPLAAPLFYAREVLLDWRRLIAGRRDLGLGRARAALGVALLPLLRLPDLAGMLRALATRPGRRPTARPADPSRSAARAR